MREEISKKMFGKNKSKKAPVTKKTPNLKNYDLTRTEEEPKKDSDLNNIEVLTVINTIWLTAISAKLGLDFCQDSCDNLPEDNSINNKINTINENLNMLNMVVKRNIFEMHNENQLLKRQLYNINLEIEKLKKEKK